MKTTAIAAAKKHAVNIAATVRDLVAMGLSNKEIFEELVAAKILTEKQRWYPAWYRAQAARLSKQ